MISEQKQEALKKLMSSLGIQESDLEESYVIGSKRGGQNQNKTSNCVILKHLPSNTVIKCQKTRSLTLNRYYARSFLCKQFQNKEGPSEKVEKIQKQKKRRLRRCKIKNINSDLL